MAFDVKKISGYTGGSAKAPGIYTYTTPDLIADVTANGYWNKLGLTLQIGDLLVCTLATATAPIVKSLVVNLSTSVDTKAAFIDVYVGDTRATDEAGYLSDNFSGNIGAGSEHKLFTYKNNTDALAVIIAASYFDKLYTVLTPGDTIYVVANDAASYVRVLDIVDGVVTTQEIVLA